MRFNSTFFLDALESWGTFAFKSYMTTLRWRYVDRDKGFDIYGKHDPVIWSLWHAQLLFPAFIGRNKGIAILISQSRDGEIVSKFSRGLGYRPVRGSTSRGGIAAAKQLAAISTTRGDCGITPDGPRGPREVAQAGAVWLAQLAGRPLLPVGAAAYPCYRFKRSWDRFCVPLPFATAAIVYGDPIFVPRRLSPAEREDYRLRLEDEMRAVTRRAEEVCRK